MATLVIGDIHGCYDELRELVDIAGIGPQDRIVALGDLFDRGPDPHSVWHFFRDQSNATAVCGNHDEKHVRARRGEQPPKSGQLVTRWLLGDEYTAAVDYLESLPAYIDLPEALLAHAAVEPGLPPAQQRPQVLQGLSDGEQHLRAAYDRPWFELYDGEKPVIVGHRDYTYQRKVFTYRDRVYGIDTRCVYGGRLTGLLLPEWRFITVPARDRHWAAVRARYGLR